jgi:hydroxymethylglutaryl-CoA lyase
VAFSDTTGMATPSSIRRLLADVLPAVGSTPIIAHLHDTRGLGLVNLMAALDCGLTRFDTSLAGMGGCPFVRGAAGNIATEDTVYLLNSLEIETGIDIGKVSECSMTLEKFFGKRFAGKLYRLTNSDPELNDLA